MKNRASYSFFSSFIKYLVLVAYFRFSFQKKKILKYCRGRKYINFAEKREILGRGAFIAFIK